jgi:hypothetical protein
MKNPILFLSIPLFSSLLFACQPVEVPPTIVARGGTYNYQVQPGTNTNKLGTNLFVQIRNSSDQKINADVYLNVKGPDSWNGNKALNLVYPKGSDWAIAPQLDVPPVVGDYEITAKIGIDANKTSEVKSSFKITDINQKVDFPKIELLEVKATSVKAKWNKLGSEVSYLSYLYNSTDSIQESETVYTKEAAAEFPASKNSNINLSQRNVNLIFVYSSNFDTTNPQPILENQVNMSDAAAFLEIGVENAMRSSKILEKKPKNVILVHR